MTDISVIIVSYNTAEMTIACIRSIIEKSEDLCFEIIVVDNASKDKSVELIKINYPQVTIVENTRNLGFAAANNIGIAISRGDYILLLNSDTLLLNNAMLESHKFMSENHIAGVIGCKVYMPNSKVQSTFFKDLDFITLLLNIVFPNFLNRIFKILGRSRYSTLDINLTNEVDVVAGCYMFIRREVINSVGPLDSDFFFYGEEAEWCYRIRKSGWKVYYYPKPEILHYGGGSTDVISSKKAVMMAKGQLLTLKKTKGPRYAYFCNILMLVRDLLRSIVFIVICILPKSKSINSMIKIIKPSFSRLPLHLYYSLFARLPK